MQHYADMNSHTRNHWSPEDVDIFKNELTLMNITTCQLKFYDSFHILGIKFILFVHNISLSVVTRIRKK